MLIRGRDNCLFGFFHRLINSFAFKLVSLLAILSNIIVLGLVKDGSSEGYDQNLETMNLAFFSFFMFELVAKVLGQGVTLYLKDRFNWFDSGVVLVSAIDVILEYSVPKSNKHLYNRFRWKSKWSQCDNGLKGISASKSLPACKALERLSGDASSHHQYLARCVEYLSTHGTLPLHLYAYRNGALRLSSPSNDSPGSLAPTNL